MPPSGEDPGQPATYFPLNFNFTSISTLKNLKKSHLQHFKTMRSMTC